MKTFIDSLSSIFLTITVYLLGGFDIALKSLLLVVILDYITGVLSAIYRKKLNSKIGIKGIIKKLCYLIIVALAVVVDNITGESGIIRTMVIYFLVANDGISVIENVGKMGIKLPNKLIEVLEQLRKEGE